MAFPCSMQYAYRYKYVYYIYIYIHKYGYKYANHHLSENTTQLLIELLWFKHMWSPHVLLEFFRELRYSFGASDTHCLCSSSTLALATIFGLVIGFWIGGIASALLLSPGLRVLLVQVLRLVVGCIGGQVHRDQAPCPDPRGRLREYRA